VVDHAGMTMNRHETRQLGYLLTPATSTNSPWRGLGRWVPGVCRVGGGERAARACCVFAPQVGGGLVGLITHGVHGSTACTQSCVVRGIRHGKKAALGPGKLCNPSDCT